MALYVVSKHHAMLYIGGLMHIHPSSQLIVLHRPPWEAFYPISELEFMPFRDGELGPSP